LGVLLYGGLISLSYSLGYFGKEPLTFLLTLAWTLISQGSSAAGESLGFLERSSTAWRPFMWPIKTVVCLGVFLMILQSLAEFFKDIGRLRGVIH
ncbi:MAG: TRAP transporter small permease subunit, partial [Halomonadaceae bacterium]